MNSHKVSFAATTPEEDRRQLIRTTLNREGGDPSRLLELLADIVEFKDWERFGIPLKQYIETPYDQGGLGWSVKDVETVLKLTHRYEVKPNYSTDITERMGVTRETIRGELRGTLRNTGRPSDDEDNDAITSFPRARLSSTGREYWIARLRRDGQHAIADRLHNDPSFTVKQAKEAVGIKPPPSRPRIDLSSPEAVAKTLIQYMPPEDIATLLGLLADAIKE